MRRRDLMRTLMLGLGGWGLFRSGLARAGGAPRPARPVDACWVTPEEDEGPYYLDSMPERSDIRESRDGVPLTLLMSVIDSECRPAAGVMVDVWQCDKNGVYSGIALPGHEPQLGQTFLRGTQTTDAQGRVQFLRIYPGWYTNRATHVHFKSRTPVPDARAHGRSGERIHGHDHDRARRRDRCRARHVGTAQDALPLSRTRRQVARTTTSVTSSACMPSPATARRSLRM